VTKFLSTGAPSFRTYLSPLKWVRANLFSGPVDSVLTLLAFYLLWISVPPFIQWAVIDADWVGNSRDRCTSGGACWVCVRVRINQFLYGAYPTDQQWCVNLGLLLFVSLLVPLMLRRIPYKRALAVLLVVVYPVVAYVLFYGGLLGLPVVETHQWGGLMLTLILAVVGIVLSLPFGILLALGRRSELPVIRAACPKGQYEAVKALGLRYWQTMGLVILPQALKLVIPGIVNTLIALF